ncbi:MAG: hypothetical protein MUE50_12845 [Pirellulaceae bacterium]|jgi:hypothetical protein|nr:hypothetical protein [Pirellulaceae bacterium]MCU0978292.1 hypothetical protein [Pirellulaceae bacterium]
MYGHANNSFVITALLLLAASPSLNGMFIKAQPSVLAANPFSGLVRRQKASAACQGMGRRRAPTV